MRPPRRRSRLYWTMGADRLPRFTAEQGHQGPPVGAEVPNPLLGRAQRRPVGGLRRLANGNGLLVTYALELVAFAVNLRVRDVVGVLGF